MQTEKAIIPLFPAVAVTILFRQKILTATSPTPTAAGLPVLMISNTQLHRFPKEIRSSLFPNRKLQREIALPTIHPITVASAAPLIPILKNPINTTSRVTLTTFAMIVMPEASLGFPSARMIYSIACRKTTKGADHTSTL